MVTIFCLGIDAAQPRLAVCGAYYYEGDEPACGAADVDEDDYDIMHDEKGDRWSTRAPIAKEYFKHIIGRQAETKKRLEAETKTRIDVPKIGQEGDVGK